MLLGTKLELEFLEETLRKHDRGSDDPETASARGELEAMLTVEQTYAEAAEYEAEGGRAPQTLAVGTAAAGAAREAAQGAEREGVKAVLSTLRAYPSSSEISPRNSRGQAER